MEVRFITASSKRDQNLKKKKKKKRRERERKCKGTPYNSCQIGSNYNPHLAYCWFYSGV